MRVSEKIPLIFGVPDKFFYGSLKAEMVFVAELRPSLSGMTVVAQELLRRHIQPVVICDNMLAFCMERGLVSEVCIFHNALNKQTSLSRTGSLIAALCAKKHDIPVYLSPGAVLEPETTSLLKVRGMKVTAQDIKTYVPLLEEVPLDLVKERV
jgi:methylthioribose-1-phosphate isomerase